MYYIKIVVFSKIKFHEQNETAVLLLEQQFLVIYDNYKFFVRYFVLRSLIYERGRKR